MYRRQRKQGEILMKKHVKIAYLVIAYMDPEQMERLAVRLSETSDVFVHINASVDLEPFRRVLADVHGKGRVFLSRERYRIVWGGYSILQATFSMMEQAFRRDRYDRFVLLTGLDYPIRSDEEIEAFFLENAHREYICANVVNGEQYNHLYYYASRDHRILHKCFQIYEKILKKYGKKGKKDYIIYKGKKYGFYGIAPKWALSGDCASYLLDFYKNNKGFNRYFKRMHAPDDFYVATVLFHSKFRDAIESRKDIFKILWLPDDKGAKILSEENYEELLNGGCLYAKKFQSGYSEGLICLLEEQGMEEGHRAWG